ncbi:MAG: mechanosensitive ion channel domain-containing protein [Elsteraceae bacterium]
MRLSRLFLLFALLFSAPAWSQTEAARPGLSPEQLKAVSDLLKDEAQRTDFLLKLEALSGAQAAVAAPGAIDPATPFGLLGGFVANLHRSIIQISAGLTGAVIALADLPQLWVWAKTQVSDPALMQRWFSLIWKVAAALAAGWIAEWVVVRLLTPWRRRVEAVNAEHWYGRLGLLAARASFDVVAIGAFAAASTILLPVLEPNFLTRLVALGLINANLLARVLLAVCRILVAPGLPSLRPLQIDDESAAYLYVWTRRLVQLSVYGYFGIEALGRVAISADAAQLLINLLAIVVVTMMVIFILQNARPVQTWLRSRIDAAAERRAAQAKSPTLGGEKAMQSAGWTLLGRIADVWHILAIGYIGATLFVWMVHIDGGFGYILRVTVLTAVLAIALRFAGIGLRRLIDQGFAVGGDLATRLPGLQARANRYMPLMSGVLHGALYLIALLILAQVWGVDVFAGMATPIGKRVLSAIVSITFVLIAALVAWELVSALIERYLTEVDSKGNPLPRSARVRTLLPLMRNAFLFVLVVVVSLIVLSELGLNIAPLLAGAGVVGLAIGFGSQQLVRDVITGLFILFEDSIRVGDVVEVAGKSGTVEGITIRAIKLRDVRGTLVTVPFGSVSLVMNMTKDFSFYVFDIAIELGKDLDRVREIVFEIDTALRGDPAIGPTLLAPLEILGIDRFDGAQIILRGRIRTIAGKQWAAGRAFNMLLQARLMAEGIWAAPAAAPPALDPAALVAALAPPRAT